MRRVTKVGGIVAVRDADYDAMTWYPLLPGMDEWHALYEKVAAEDAEGDTRSCSLRYARHVREGRRRGDHVCRWILSWT